MFRGPPGVAVPMSCLGFQSRGRKHFHFIVMKFKVQSVFIILVA